MTESKSQRADRIAQMRAKLQQLEAAETAAQRKADARSKIILGGAVIAEMNNNPDFRHIVAGILRNRVIRPKDQEAVQQWLSTSSQQASLPGAEVTAAPQRQPTELANA